jgi:tripartite-type tricarboxylate transporter receptor subunit TctC
MVGWNGVFVPKGTAGDIIGKLHEALVTVLRSPAVKDQMAGLGAEAVGNPQGEFAAFVKAESTRWGAIIREKGIKPE